MELISSRPGKPERTLAHMAGESCYVDDRGRAWGIRTFKLRELDMFESMHSLARDNHVAAIPESLKRLSWLSYLQLCIVCRAPVPGVCVTIRRVLGLPDYSRRALRPLTRQIRPPVEDAIVLANFEHKTLAEMLNKITEQVKRESERQKGKKKKQPLPTTRWDEVMAAYFLHWNVAPEKFFDLTLPQIAAIGEKIEQENRDARIEAQRPNRGIG